MNGDALHMTKLRHRIDRLEQQRAALVEALKMAVRQNSHDMLMTGDELRECNAALRAAGVVLP